MVKGAEKMTAKLSSAMCLTAIICFGVTVEGQRVLDPQTSTPAEIAAEQRRQEQRRRVSTVPSVIPDSVGPNLRRPILTKEKRAEIAERLRRAAETKEMLAVPAKYYVQFADRLKGKKTNLARLFVNKNCDTGMVVAVEEVERCADVIPVKGGGSFYSFRFKTNVYFGDDWWDINFKDNKLLIGNETVQGIIAEVGAAELEEVNLKSPAAKLLSDYEPKKTLVEIKEQNKLFEKGLRTNDGVYFNWAPVRFNQTYVLRLVAYRLKEERRYVMRQETGVDLFVAFKIVGQESDGSLILLWKELKEELPRWTIDNTVINTK
jgi:hypothetical protein